MSSLEIELVMKLIKNKKACGTDGIAGESIKYGGSGMSMMLRELFQLVWNSECIPEYWEEGMIVSLFKKGDQEDPNSYSGIMLLNVLDNYFTRFRIIKYCIGWRTTIHCQNLSRF